LRNGELREGDARVALLRLWHRREGSLDHGGNGAGGGDRQYLRRSREPRRHEAKEHLTAAERGECGAQNLGRGSGGFGLRHLA